MKKIKIPQRKLLSSTDLIKYRNQEVFINKNGIKRTKCKNSNEEKLELKRKLDDLKQQISNERIDRISNRSKAQWNDSTKTIKLIKKEGKFQSFGYSQNGQEYLDKFETLFLIELNRLELYWNDVLVSVEQAYTLLLGEERNKNYDKYLIFSTLSRCGYIVQTYKNHDYNIEKPTNLDCLWEILKNSLNAKYEIPEIIKNESTFNSIKQSFNVIKNVIQNNSQSIDKSTPSCSSSAINFNRKISSKRKATNVDHWIGSKKLKLSKNCKSFLDILKDEPEYKKFENIFEKFGTFHLNQNDFGEFIEENNIQNLEISFDLHLPKDVFKKTDPNQPNLRVIIIDADEIFPNYNEIMKCFNCQKFKVPLVIASISESKHIQGFLYYIN